MGVRLYALRRSLLIGAARLLLIAAFLAAWQLTSGTVFNSFWLPAPSDIFVDLKEWIITGSLWPQLLATLEAMAGGYLLGCAGGVLFGLILGRMGRTYKVLAPYITAFYSVPKIAFAPLFVIVFGIGLASKIALVVTSVFFILLYSTLDGCRDIDEDLVSALFLMGATRSEIFVKVLAPSTVPWILTGMRIALPNALTAVVLAELISSNRGLGYLISYYSGQYDSVGVYAAIVVLLACSVIIAAILNRFDNPLARSQN
jgi:NitT/TauT family transport system permease protein